MYLLKNKSTETSEEASFQLRARKNLNKMNNNMKSNKGQKRKY